MVVMASRTWLGSGVLDLEELADDVGFSVRIDVQLGSQLLHLLELGIAGAGDHDLAIDREQPRPVGDVHVQRRERLDDVFGLGVG